MAMKAIYSFHENKGFELNKDRDIRLSDNSWIIFCHDLAKWLSHFLFSFSISFFFYLVELLL